jgi:hypothetical protein
VQLYSIIKILKEDSPEDYGAYQLTLIPYGLMSLVNTVSGIVSPSYPSVYMVGSTVMEEARKRGGVFDGVVGTLQEVKPGTAKKAEGHATEGSQPPTAMMIRTEGDAVGGGSGVGKNDPIIRYNHFWPHRGGTFRARGYFHFLRMAIPLLRLIKHTSEDSHPAKGNSESYFLRKFNRREGRESDSRKHYFILEIGNVQYRTAAWPWMPLFMDILMIIALAVPFVTIYKLTEFRAPPDIQRGIVFMLWLALGEFLPFFLVPSWSFVSRKIWRVELNWAIFWSILGTSVFTLAAFAGFYFVGEMKYKELAAANDNCSESPKPIPLHELCH